MQQDPPPPRDEPGEGSGWLPPQPSGPPPNVGSGAPPPPPAAAPVPEHQAPPSQPPPGRQTPAHGYPPQGWPPQPQEPGNGEAVGGFVCGVAALALLLVTFGLSTIVSLVCSIVAIFLGRRGKQKLERGETRKHGGLAQAAFITGLIGVPLSIMATVAWVLIVLSDDFQEGFEEGLEDSQSSTAVPLLRVAVSAGRTLLA